MAVAEQELVVPLPHRRDIPQRLGVARAPFWRAILRQPVAVASALCLILIILATILAPLIAPYDPLKMDYDSLLQAPSALHPFGTDESGRDILSRVLWGGRESLRVSVLAVALGMGGGLLMGLAAGFYGAWIDALLMRAVDVFMAFPGILLLLSIVAVLGPGLGTVLIALGLSSIPVAGRLVRGSVLSVRHLDYVAAAQVTGATGARIMFRHILPNVIAPISVYVTLSLGGAIMATAGLSYLGLGAQPPSPEWGAMLNYGNAHLRDAWWMSVFPGLAIFLVVLCTNMLGDVLRDVLDPRLRG